MIVKKALLYLFVSKSHSITTPLLDVAPLKYRVQHRVQLLLYIFNEQGLPKRQAILRTQVPVVSDYIHQLLAYGCNEHIKEIKPSQQKAGALVGSAARQGPTGTKSSLCDAAGKAAADTTKVSIPRGGS